MGNITKHVPSVMFVVKLFVTFYCIMRCALTICIFNYQSSVRWWCYVCISM